MKHIAQKAEETAQDVAEAVSKAAIWAFMALLLGVITAALSGYLGKPNDTVRDTTRTVRSEIP